MLASKCTLAMIRQHVSSIQMIWHHASYMKWRCKSTSMLVSYIKHETNKTKTLFRHSLWGRLTAGPGKLEHSWHSPLNKEPYYHFRLSKIFFYSNFARFSSVQTLQDFLLLKLCKTFFCSYTAEFLPQNTDSSLHYFLQSLTSKTWFQNLIN